MSVSVADEIVNGDDFNNETSTMDVGDNNKKEPITINADDGSKIVGGETVRDGEFCQANFPKVLSKYFASTFSRWRRPWRSFIVN